jgi:hypothetical protein
MKFGVPGHFITNFKTDASELDLWHNDLKIGVEG